MRFSSKNTDLSLSHIEERPVNPGNRTSHTPLLLHVSAQLGTAGGMANLISQINMDSLCYSSGQAWGLVLLAFLSCAWNTASAATIQLDRNGANRVFDGIGAISGGGATSRLLVDYPERERAQILDFLFKPQFGASLHLLKVEIGGDSQSTDGCESSHMHSQDDLDLTRGYEWWLMKEAKARNPDIKLYGLPWAFPGWVSNSTEFPYSKPERIANYTVNWVEGAKKLHGLDIDFLGIWNERPSDATYVMTLRKMLDARGFPNTRIVVADGGLDVCKDLATDPDYKRAVDVLGFHYPKEDDGGWPACKELNLPMWASEESSSYDDENGAQCWSRVLNAHFVLNNITSSIMWNLVGSYFHGTMWYASSLMTAVEPWSGHYDVAPVVWATAHITQFTQIGWKYLDVGSGSGQFSKGGYYVTMIDADTRNFTLNAVKVAENHAFCTRPALPREDVTPVETENIKFVLADSFKEWLPMTLYVWRSNFDIAAGISKTEFVKERAIELTATSQSFELEINVGDVVTVSTIGNAKKGVTRKSPPSQPQFPLPYSSGFEQVAVAQEGEYWTDQIGIFEVHAELPGTGNGKANKVMRQMVPATPIGWKDHGSRGPISVIGMLEWQDIAISARFKIPTQSHSRNHVARAACLSTRTDQTWSQGVVFCYATEDGSWSVTSEGPLLNGTFTPSTKVYASGKNKTVKQGEWISMSLETSENGGAAGHVNGRALFSNLSVRAVDFGFAAIGCNDWFGLQVDDVKITTVGDEKEKKNSSLGSAKAGDTVGVAPCPRNGELSEASTWELLSSWQMRHVASGLCAEIEALKSGSKVFLAECARREERNNGGALQMQQFWNDYTRIRNNPASILIGANPDATKLQLAGSLDGTLFVAEDDVDKAAAQWSTWTYFPNTRQIRNMYTAQEGFGDQVIDNPWDKHGAEGLVLYLHQGESQCFQVQLLSKSDLGGPKHLPLMVVNLTSVPSPQLRIAVQTCAGLFNRNESIAGPAYTLMSDRDSDWLSAIEETPTSVSPTDFLHTCLVTSGVAKGYIRYNYTGQRRVIPNIITLAAVLDAVPLEDTDPLVSGAELVFDSVEALSGFSALDATSYVFERYSNKTTTMSKMNPGLDTHKHPIRPPLVKDINTGLVDYIVKERLFNFFLSQGCIPGTKEHALMEKIANDNPWPRPIRVYGYDDTYGVEGDLFEAETNCVKEHNMGQIASDGVNNLAFFSRKSAITEPLQQNPKQLPGIPYNDSRTYMALVVGDGDNIGYVKGEHFDWMSKRVKACKQDPSPRSGCFPLVWTQSPHALHLAPDMMKWYYNQAKQTTQDYFVLPPSGDLYSYPGIMEDDDQVRFVANTERDCKLMNTSATVDWEWFGTWPEAIKRLFPRYAKNGIVRGLFAVNVPFMIPVFAFAEGEFYKIFENSTVLFRPRSWRGEAKSKIPFSHKEYLSAKDMASEINNYPKGTVSYIYLTSDGGARLESLYKLVPLLDEHVSIVDHDTLVDMALQRG
eukprot:jgi/Bigna1/91286/estExt_fgenesh1_pg.C_950041